MMENIKRKRASERAIESEAFSLCARISMERDGSYSTQNTATRVLLALVFSLSRSLFRLMITVNFRKNRSVYIPLYRRQDNINLLTQPKSKKRRKEEVKKKERKNEKNRRTCSLYRDVVDKYLIDFVHETGANQTFCVCSLSALNSRV